MRRMRPGCVQDGIAIDENWYASDAANLIIPDGEVASLNGPLEPREIGRVDRPGQRDTVAEDIAIWLECSEVGIERVLVLHVATAPALLQTGSCRLRQFQGVVQLAACQESGVRGNRGAVEFQA